MPEGALESVIDNISTFAGGAVGWMTTMVSTVTSNAVLFIFVVGMPVGGYGVGLLRRVIHA